MEYVVTRDYYNNEFDFELHEGEIVDEAFFASEPDLVGNLVIFGVLAEAGEDAAPDLELIDEDEDAGEEE